MTAFLVLLALAAALGFHFWRERETRSKLLTQPLDSAQQAMLAPRFPIYQKLPNNLRVKLDGKINLFLDQVKFHGVDDLDVTDEMRLLIAAQACLLIVNKDNRWYDDLQTILIYPGAFKSKQVERDGYVETETEHSRIGESWESGPVVLSWAHAERGAFIDDDGHNVVMHEFAHQLDDQTGDTDGAPILDKDHDPEQWAAAFRDGYARLKADIEAGRDTFIDPYGATAHAEFFAVVVEVFFERSAELKREEPAVYEQLTEYFEVDPAGW